MSKIPSSIAVILIRAYQLVVSPLLPPSCKYHPSCSQYAIDALRQYGILRGTVLAGWRIMRCNPFSHGGHDPVENQRLFRTRSAGRVEQGPTDPRSATTGGASV